jgi:excisionase family DNA binding protein
MTHLTLIDQKRGIKTNKDLLYPEKRGMLETEVRGMEKAIMNVEEVAEYLRFSVKKIYRLVESIGIPASKIGRQYRFLKSAIDQWLEDRMISNQSLRNQSLDRNVPWAVTPQKIKVAIEQIVNVANPCKVILFGSAARGQLEVNSDMDILVVTKNEVESPRAESVRIRRALRGISMPMDILVISDRSLQELKDIPGLVYREVLRSGKIVYEAPS